MQGARDVLDREGAGYFVTRVGNGALALVHTAVAVVAVGAGDAGRFFLIWTAAWLLATVARFGVDGVLPRAVAEAKLDAGAWMGFGRALATGAVVALLAVAPLLMAFDLPVTPVTVPALSGLTLAWAATFVLSGILRAHSRVALSGAVAFVIWPLGSVVAAGLVALLGGSWEELALATLAGSVVSLAIAVAVTVHAVGTQATRSVVRFGDRLEADTVGAALDSSLTEAMIWLPVILAALSGAAPALIAAVFTATRVAGLFSWTYQAVVAVLTPRLAAATARPDVDRLRRLLNQGALAGTALTLPLVVVGALLGDSLLAAFDVDAGAVEATFVLLLGARVADAAAGPVGEALLVGRRARLDAALLAIALAAGLTVGLAAWETLGATAAGLGGAVALVTVNLLRFSVVRHRLARGWCAEGPPERRAGRLAHCAIPAVPAVAAIGLLASASPAGGSGAALLASAGAGAAAVAVIAAAVMRVGALGAATSPVAICAVLLLAHFAIRPASLILDPGSVTAGVATIGFSASDLADATVVGAGGTLALAVGFLLLMGRASSPARGVLRNASPGRIHGGLLAVATMGCVLWGALFLRLGGPRQLLADPAAIHLGQFGGAWGVAGMHLCFGAALVALLHWCVVSPRRATARVAAVCFAMGTAASIALATRGPLIAAAAAAAFLIAHYRPPTRRRLLAASAVALVAVSGLLLMRSVRDYAQVQPLPDAAVSTVRTSPVDLVAPELVEFDHLLGLRRLVPDGLPWLEGRSFAEVPATFLPRRLWPRKPRPIDFELSAALYGEGTATGTPFTLAGEAFWNFGFAGGLLAMLFLGALWGAAWRRLLSAHGRLTALPAALLFGWSYLIVTRPLGPMLLGFVLALAGVGLAAASASLWRPSPREWLASRRFPGARAMQPLKPPSHALERAADPARGPT